MHREFCALLRSPPTRRCGLKSRPAPKRWNPEQVTSYAEVWIEMHDNVEVLRRDVVTSYAEVWIEMLS